MNRSAGLGVFIPALMLAHYMAAYVVIVHAGTKGSPGIFEYADHPKVDHVASYIFAPIYEPAHRLGFQQATYLPLERLIRAVQTRVNPGSQREISIRRNPLSLILGDRTVQRQPDMAEIHPAPPF